MDDFRDPRFDEPTEDKPFDDTFDEPRKGRGCLFWGCLVTAILFLVVLIGVPVGGYFAIKHYLKKVTAEAPADIAVVELPEEELAELTTRFETFSEAVQAGEAPDDLELTAEEINGLINQNEELRDRVFVRVADGKIGGDVSFPADKLPGGAGRFFNASVDFDVSMENGKLVVVLADATVNGAPLPQPMLQAFANENLAKDVDKDPEAAELLNKFESIEITGDRILLRAKRSAPAEGDADVAGEIESFEEAEEPVGAN